MESGHIDVARETETFAPVSRETRTHTGLAAGAWATDRLRITGRAGIDRWLDRRRQALVGADAEFWPIADRLQLRGRISHWSGADAFSAGSVDAMFRSSAARSGDLLLLRAGESAATDAAPALAWPGADTGHVRDVLLRANPAPRSGGHFRRRVRTTTDIRRSRVSTMVEADEAAGAVCASGIHRYREGVPGPCIKLLSTAIDAGVGSRIAAPGSKVLLIDLAHGLRDGRTALSVMWGREVPRKPPGTQAVRESSDRADCSRQEIGTDDERCREELRAERFRGRKHGEPQPHP